FLGWRELAALDLAQIARYIDWGPFFKTWELAGSYPAILDDAHVGTQARRLFEDAQKMLARIVNERWLTASAVVGFYPANSDGDDIAIFTDATRHKRLFAWYGLRQQTRKPVIDGVARPNRALADFVGPPGIDDYLGMFAVTAGLGLEVREAIYAAQHDDYDAILLKALADRLAEAAAEMLHERVRRDLWGYVPDENLKPEQLLKEAYRGIRPAPGYPACPEHSVKRDLLAALHAECIGMGLTESFAMTPASSISGFYFAHPQARYFVVGPIGRDQLEDQARRRGLDVAVLARWLAPNLSDLGQA
ncbi:MAG TPA: vitamin B12 dependent-methionine synthase activation domain-containing protein, partial [Burkholderiaceae bacterium]|nr:vitamin B12 dependent-methionine synthase activation domain-containing protein [Burkholderiaceae bacterium]